VGFGYRCTNVGEERRAAVFVSEWNLSPPQSPEGDDRTAVIEAGERTIDATGAAGAVGAVRGFAVRGSADYELRCEADAPAEVWHFPVESVSSSEGGVERVFQGISLSIVRRLELAPGETAAFGFSWTVAACSG